MSALLCAVLPAVCTSSSLPVKDEWAAFVDAGQSAAAKLHKRIKYRFFTSQIRPSMRAAGSQRVHFVDPEEWLGVAGMLCCMSWICFVSPGLGEEECP